MESEAPPFGDQLLAAAALPDQKSKLTAFANDIRRLPPDVLKACSRPCFHTARVAHVADHHTTTHTRVA